MTTAEAATLLNVSIRRVAKIIDQGNLKATKHGRDWWIEEAEVQRYQQERRQAGRPRKDK